MAYFQRDTNLFHCCLRNKPNLWILSFRSLGNIFFRCAHDYSSPRQTAATDDVESIRGDEGRAGRLQTGDWRQETGDRSQSGSMSDTDTGTDSETQTPDASASK